MEKIELRDQDLMGDLRDAFNEYLPSRNQTPPLKSQDSSSQGQNPLLKQIPAEAESAETEENAEVASSV